MSDDPLTDREFALAVCAVAVVTLGVRNDIDDVEMNAAAACATAAVLKARAGDADSRALVLESTECVLGAVRNILAAQAAVTDRPH